MGWSKVVDGCYFGSDGRMVTSGWVNDGKDNSGHWYYVGSDQKVVTGWKKIDDEWCYFDENGKMQKGWLQDNGNWYHLDSNGAM